MKHVISAAFVLTAFLTLSAQAPKYRVISVPVMRNGVQVKEPWTGGMDSPQFWPIDLNNDGIKDLFVFDRVGNKVLTYLSNGTGGENQYTYAPQYEKLFPTDLQSWAEVIDYANNGTPYIIAHSSYPSNSNDGIRTYKGNFQSGNLQFDLLDPIVTYTDSNLTPVIFANLADIPCFVDVNGDGDVDILTYSRFGTTISYYENQAVETGGNPDLFQYKFITSCWGNIAQNFATNSITLNDSNGCTYGALPPSGGGNNTRHAGNSLFPVTDPTYHTIDLLNGNIGYDNLFLLQNCGNRQNANVCAWDSIFPSCSPIFMPNYPASFGIDISGAAGLDLLVAPNVAAPYFVGGGVGRNVKNVMYYKYTGDTSCWYTYQNDSFIVHNMLDFGTDSKALFYDVDGDGQLDIIAGSYGYFVPNQPYNSTLAYYRNTGTATQPRFEETNLNFANMNAYGLTSVNPAFGDLDGDGKKDMLIGDGNGDLNFFKNEDTGAGSSFPSMTAAQYFGINVGQNAAPFIYDVNGDSLPDLIVGSQAGNLSYFQNTGTKTNPQFNSAPTNANLGNVNVTLSGFNYGYSQPFINRDSAGNMLLFVGSVRGLIFEYLLDPNKLLGGSFTLIDSNFLHQNAGAQTTISIADINNDGKPEYLVGNAMGGLELYSDSLWDSSTVLSIANILPNKGDMHIYPNPAQEYFICSPDNVEFSNPKTEVFNVLGEKMPVDVKLTNNNIRVNTSLLSNGFYLVRIIDMGKIFNGKVLLER
jgi:hypothetical protein